MPFQKLECRQIGLARSTAFQKNALGEVEKDKYLQEIRIGTLPASSYERVSFKLPRLKKETRE